MRNDTTTTPIRILLIDDHQILLSGLQSLLNSEPGFSVVGTAQNRCESLLAANSQPDIILLDLKLGNESTLDFFGELMSVCHRARLLVLTGNTDTDLHLRAVCKGATGVVSKMETSDLLVRAIRKVHAGEMWLNRSTIANAVSQIQSRQVKLNPAAARIASLTVRELDVISILGTGCRNKEIGERMFISEKTVRHYLTSIYRKLGVEDRLELMVFSNRHGLSRVPRPSIAYISKFEKYRS